MDKFANWLNVEVVNGLSRFEVGILGLIIIGVVVVICNRKLWKKFF